MVVALITCDKCGGIVRTKTVARPHCGVPVAISGLLLIRKEKLARQPL